MQKIKDLHAFIINLNLFAAENMDSDIDELMITASGRSTDNAGEIVIAEYDYIASFYIERYPHKNVPVTNLMSHVCGWLIDNDPTRIETFNFNCVAEVLDVDTVNLEFDIKFKEQTLAAEDPAGLLVFNDKNYRLL